MSGILHESWLGKVVAGWDHVRKLNAFEEHYPVWILWLRGETLVQEKKYLASHLFLLWNNASQKLRIISHFAKCELLIRTLHSFFISIQVNWVEAHYAYASLSLKLTCGLKLALKHPNVWKQNIQISYNTLTSLIFFSY